MNFRDEPKPLRDPAVYLGLALAAGGVAMVLGLASGGL